MGKTRKQKPRKIKVNPIGLPSVHDVNLEEDLLERDKPSGGPINAVIEQLQSHNVEEKLSGLQILSTLCQNQQNIAAIIETDLIRIAAPLLLDPTNSSIRNSAAGAIRNLSAVSVEVCEVLVEQDVLTPLLLLLKEYADLGAWTPTFDKHFKDQMDEKSDTFLQAVNIVWNLCESTSIAVDSFNESNLLDSFVRGLNYVDFGMNISIAVGQCLLVISEDNPISWRVLGNFGCEFCNLLELDGHYPEMFLRTLAAGIMSNVPALTSPYSLQIFTALSKTLDENYRTVVSNLTSDLPLIQKDRPIELEVTDDCKPMEEETEEAAVRRRRRNDLPSQIEIQVKHVGWLLEAQRVAAETITNICTIDDETTAEVINEDSDAESVHDYDANTSTHSGQLQNNYNMPVDILEAIKSLGLIEKLWQRAQPIPENVSQLLRENEKGLMKKLKSLRVSCLLCLHNLCNSMSTEDLGGPQAIYNVWLDLGQQVFQGTNDVHLLEASTALMRAALDHLRNCQELFKQMSDNDLQLMLNGVQSCTEPEIRANWLRMLGILGCFLPENLVQIIITFIMETSARETDAWTISEAMDSLMDIFSDNDWNQIVYELNLLQKSKELERQLKNKLRQQKNDLGERYSAVCTVRTNLARFTKYIEAEMKKYVPREM